MLLGVRRAQQLRTASRISHTLVARRCLASHPPKTSFKDGVYEPSAFSKWLMANPTALDIFRRTIHLLRLDSPSAMVGTRSLAIYAQVVAPVADIDKLFWQQECHLPPTFQSWFTVTSLHIWLLTVRLRALPPQYGKLYIQALLDQYFTDTEDRIRAILQPQWKQPKPYTFHSEFYINPNAPAPGQSPDTTTLAREPERVVSRHMKVFREQWHGLTVAMDLGLIKGDMEMSAAVWRNLLGARGAQGIALPGDAAKYRRSVNLVGSEIEPIEKVDIEKESLRDDGSGVHDFPPEEADKYLAYPELMCEITTYLRRELKRLEGISDQDIFNGSLETLAFRSIRP